MDKPNKTSPLYKTGEEFSQIVGIPQSPPRIDIVTLHFLFYRGSKQH